jgi:diguanylate cyclase (GGDEF)-like protein
VAFFIAELEGDYACLFNRGIFDGAMDNDVNLLVFPGKTPKIPYFYQYQCNVIYDLVNVDNVDALILPSGLYCNYLSKEEYEKFYRRYLPLPIVSITIPLPEAVNVVVNNKKGLYDALNHLIRDHHCRRIAFIKGPEFNSEAEERYAVYLEVLNENKLPYDPDLVCPGDFTCYAATEAVNTLLDIRKVKFDALVAANDEMALTAMAALQSRNIRIPEDVAVVGFDDVEGARISSPSLTTVRQPIYEMAKKSVDLATSLIRGERVSANIIMNTEVVIRESCGCMSKEFQYINKVPVLELGRGSIQHLNKIQEVFVNNEMREIDRAKIKKKVIINFIDQIFKVFENLDGPLHTQELLDYIMTAINRENIGDDDVLYLQNMISRLRKRILRFASGHKNLIQIADFFDELRVLLMQVFIRRNARLWAIHHNDVRVLRGVLSGMIPKIYDTGESLDAITRELKQLGLSSCYIYLYEREISHYREQEWAMPPSAELLMAYNKEGLELKHKGQHISAFRILNNEFLPQKERYVMVLNPLFFMEEQLGLMLCEFKIDDSYMYESIFVEISCALKLYYLIKAREQIETRLRDALHELEIYNERLNCISQTDDLTELLNRRGFLSLARQNLDLARRIKKNGLLFYADLDGLKVINDNFGHEEGDIAIQQTAQLLRKAFRNADIIARLGGDEFTIFTVDSAESFIEELQNRLNRLIDEYNDHSGKPYLISISIGAVPFSGDDNIKIEQLLAQADNLLYEQKKAKKQRRISLLREPGPRE